MTISTFESFRIGQLYIWIWHADKIPPHIGCSINNNYFSLKVNGLDFNFPVQTALRTMASKNIPSLLLETSIQVDENLVAATFEKCKDAIHEGQSCLYPIKQVLNFGDEIEKVKDLIHRLEENDEINHIFGFNLKDDFNGIPEYSVEDISKRLNFLRDVKR